jgi:cytochrome P450
MDEQEEDIVGRVHGFIDSFIDNGECNFTEEFAEIFPSSVFLGLLGLPEEDLRMFLDLRDGILHPDRHDPEAALDLTKRSAINERYGQEIYRYFGELIDERRKTPTNDIISRFIAADVDGDRLSDEEILDIFFLFLIAGLDTVTNTLTCFYAFLATHSEHRRQIVANPEIINSAVEEMLRWETPVPTGAPRIALEDVELPGGQRLAAGTTVLFNWGAANVDPEVFEDPFEIRFDRESNPHIAFGSGVHRCLGSHLARRELRITLREWHKRIPEYRLTPGHEELEYQVGLRHVTNLMLSWP